MEQAMAEFADNQFLKVKRKAGMDNGVLLVAPRVEAQEDDTRTQTERGKMTSTAGSHGEGPSRGVEDALSVGFPSVLVSRTPQYRKPFSGYLTGLGYGLVHEGPLRVDYDLVEGITTPCVTVGTKSYSDGQAEQRIVSSTETQAASRSAKVCSGFSYTQC